EALRGIPVDYQVILELHYWEQMNTEDMAEALALPVGTVRSRLRRARELLEQAMGRLAESPGELQSTLTRLDDWAERCRQEMQRRT
ncbi:MAG TPA: sigma factor-like helix-turn-helix DNA-binding protein, partial [Haliangium sp.]|nr:sigma factor-like helix-turn-helix DNA-binding protein [Haliangium sp.]